MKELIKKLSHSFIIIAIGLSLIVNFIVEILCQGGIRQAIGYAFGSPIIFLYNSMIIFLTLQIVFLCKRRIFVTSIIVIIWITLGATNGVILSHRVTPLTYIDLTMASNVMTIINKYLTSFQLKLIIVAAIILIGILTVVFIYSPQKKEKISYKRNIVGIAIYVCIFIGTTYGVLKSGIISTYFGNIANAYLEYGFPYSFSSTALNTGISRPMNYSEETIKSIFANETKEESENTDVNIIMLQLESFFDPSRVKGIELSENPIPTFTSLREKYSSGFLEVPGYGAGTANTEFEVMTGMSLDYFGTGEYPFKTILKKETSESIAYDLKALGYSTHAIHNNRSTFYSRNKVFPNLGFDTFTSIEFMNAYEKNALDWSEDKYLTEEIIKSIENTEEKDYVYTISVQGHGEYPSKVIDDTQTITIDGIADEAEKNAFEYYVNQINEMDEFVKNLIQELEKTGEKVVLVMYGDHLPTLKLNGDEISDNDLENANRYETEYIIWDNIGLDKQDGKLFAYQLSAEVTDRLGIHNGTLLRYHQKYKDTPNYQTNLKLLQYDMLYGKQYVYGQKNPFEPAEMRYDVEDTSISKVYSWNEDIYIAGDNFTEYSKVYVNGDKLSTKFISKYLLKVEDEVLEDEDEVVVKQIGANGKTELSECEPFIFRNSVLNK